MVGSERLARPGRVPASYEEFVSARYQALVRSAYLLTGHHHDAEDLVQTALLRAVSRWRRIEDNPEPYVRKIMVNENISRWRRHRGREHLAEAVPDAPAPSGDHDDAVELRRALSQLSPRQRTVVVLRYYEDLTERQVAELLGIGVGTVKSTTRDALARLRTQEATVGLRT